MNEVAIGLAVPEFALALARHRLTPSGYAGVTTAPMFNPEEAMRPGYLDSVVPAEAMSTVVTEELTRLRGLGRTHFRRTKARIHQAAAAQIREAAEQELQALAVA